MGSPLERLADMKNNKSQVTPHTGFTDLCMTEQQVNIWDSIKLGVYETHSLT